MYVCIYQNNPMNICNYCNEKRKGVLIWWGFLSDSESHKEGRRKPEIAFVWMIERGYL